METKIPVKEIMTRDVITIQGDRDVQDASMKMVEKEVGSLVVVDKENKPIGIITERDLVRKVLSKGKSIGTRIKKVMTEPLVSVNKNEELNEAIRKMRDLNIKKLPVIESGKLEGIMTETDVLSISPEMNEILGEATTFTQNPNRTEDWETGICESCSSFSKNLQSVEGGVLLCEQCREETEVEGAEAQ
ncbi:MAG: CBS domain containing protein [Candidatus Methanohalarchaeum thermophilum]|uniref:CBS domain containing protein n=1 Tax=Methanohalarchaeum thermophilum TaxID=1903181 RepID=A0A1Q6DV27_METT1|nr:MAG: CBS domain containing protein [Candidatus Methanohalarchaeum thermophilum]